MASNTGTHDYNCQVWGDGCIAPRLDSEDIKITWQTEPGFGGLTSATNAEAESCAIDLSWEPADPACGGPVVYNVYRSTTQGFEPGPGVAGR